ncbi:MAG TPA: hypothetical protein VGC14_02645 [Rhizobium sp.]
MRKEIDFPITEAGRDQGKLFHLKEMPALKAEKWAMRALLAVARSGVDIGQAATGGMQSLAILGIEALTKISFEEAEPLLDEMLECITVKPSPQNPNIVRQLMEDDIEEVKTLLALRKEVLNLHLGFSPAGAPSKQTSETSASPSSNIPTSQDPSVRFSRSPKAKPQR